MPTPDAIELAQRLVRIDTMNPPGNEAVAAGVLAPLLAGAGYEVVQHEFAPGRPSLVACIGDEPYLAFTGHLDTMPQGQAPWSFDPLCGQIKDGNLLGRGAADMKCGLAALTVMALEMAPFVCGPGLCLILTASEETGCEGARSLVAQKGLLPPALGLVVAEPSACLPALGHKGVMWLEAVTRGKAAHGSMPHAGDNAIYKAARAITLLESYDFGAPAHPELGTPTLNVGVMSGGSKVNMVPDLARFKIDLRLTPGMEPRQVQAAMARALGPQVELSAGPATAAVWTDPGDPWIRRSLAAMEPVLGRITPGGVSYFTDAAFLGPALGAPVMILGPAQPEAAHQTDESCPLEHIQRALACYRALARDHLSG